MDNINTNITNLRNILRRYNSTNIPTNSNVHTYMNTSGAQTNNTANLINHRDMVINPNNNNTTVEGRMNLIVLVEIMKIMNQIEYMV